MPHRSSSFPWARPGAGEGFDAACHCSLACCRAQRMLSWSLMATFTKDNSYVEFNERPADEQLVGGHTACRARHTMATLNAPHATAPRRAISQCFVWFAFGNASGQHRARLFGTRRAALCCAAPVASMHCCRRLPPCGCEATAAPVRRRLAHHALDHCERVQRSGGVCARAPAYVG